LPEKGRQQSGSTAWSALKEAKVNRLSGSVPPAIIVRAAPVRIRSRAMPMAVAPDEQAVMSVVFGPQRSNCVARWLAVEAQETGARRENRALRDPRLR